MTALEKCLHCGETLTKNKNPNRVYCNRRCMGAGYSNQTARDCAVCGARFTRRAADPSRFCSVPCKNIGIADQVPCVCANCGERFTRSSYRISRGAGKYCCRACRDEHWRTTPSANSHWKQGVSPEREGPTTAKWKRLVVARAGHACEDCGITGVTITAHHLYPWRDWPQLRQHPLNGRALCHPCHTRTYRKEYQYLAALGMPVSPPDEWCAHHAESLTE